MSSVKLTRSDAIRQSYGGFMASKIAEANAGVHSLAIAVAVCGSFQLTKGWCVECATDLTSGTACDKLAVVW
jgi:hypothetical protein